MTVTLLTPELRRVLDDLARRLGILERRIRPTATSSAAHTHDGEGTDAVILSGDTQSNAPIATGAAAVAAGEGAIGDGAWATAIGPGAQAGGNNDDATALGHAARALGAHSTAIGDGTFVSGDYSMSIGSAVSVTAAHRIALGTVAEEVRIDGTLVLRNPSDGSSWTPTEDAATGADLAAHAAAADPHTGYLKESVVSGMAAPTIALGATAAAGVATTAISSDATIDAFDTTAPNVIEPDDAAAVGVINFAARRDHEHGIVTAVAGASEMGAAAAEGTATSFSRSDHAHSRSDDATQFWMQVGV